MSMDYADRRKAIAQGVKPGFEEAIRFGSIRRDEVLNSLNTEHIKEGDIFDSIGSFSSASRSASEPVPPININAAPNAAPIVDSPLFQSDETELDEKNMHALVKSMFDTGRIDEVRVMFEFFIDKYSKILEDKSLSEEEVTAYQKKLESKKNQLLLFDREFEIINIFESMINDINHYLEKINTSFRELVQVLKNKDFNLQKINDLLNRITSSCGKTENVNSYYSLITNLNNMKIEYKELIGEDYKSLKPIHFFKKDFINTICEEIISALKILNDLISKETDEFKKANYQKIKMSLEYFVRSEEIFLALLENPLDFNDIRTNIEKSLNDIKSYDEATKETNNAKQEFKELLQRKIDKLHFVLRLSLSLFVLNNDDSMSLFEDIKLFMTKETRLARDEKQEIYDKMYNEMIQKLIAEFGTESFDFFNDYSDRLNQLIQITSTSKLGDPEFNKNYGELMNLILEMASNGSKKGIKVEFDKDSQILEINFPNKNIGKYNRCIVSYETLKAMQGKPENKEKDKELQASLFKEAVEKFFTELDAQSEKAIIELYYLTEDDYSHSMDIIFFDSKYNLLSVDEKNKIINDIGAKHQNDFFRKYNESSVKFIINVIIAEYQKIDFDRLAKISYDSPNFELERQTVIAKIHQFIKAVSNAENSSKYIKEIKFDDQNQKLIISYNDNSIPPFEKTIVSDSVLKKINDSTVKPVPPVQPVPPIPPVDTGEKPDYGARFNPDMPHINDDMQKAIDDYIFKLNQLNDIVDLLNELNVRLEILTMNDILKNASEVISLSEQAKDLDKKQMALRIELSQDRLAFKQKFNQFILQIPKVHEIPLKEVIFDGEFSDFINQHDEMIIRAENRILQLIQIKSPSSADKIKINDEIEMLLEFIDAQNSFIGRRMVFESKNRKIDIVSLLKQRRENKQDIREKINEAKKQEAESPEFNNEENNKKKEDLKKALIAKLKEELQIQLKNQIEFGNTEVLISNFSDETKQLLAEFKKYANEEEVEALLNTYGDEYQRIVNGSTERYFAHFIEDIKKLKESITIDDVNKPHFREKIDEQLEEIVSKYQMIDSLTAFYNATDNVLSIGGKVTSYDFASESFVTKNIHVDYKNLLDPDLYSIFKQEENKPLNNEMFSVVAKYFIENYSTVSISQLEAVNNITNLYGFSNEDVFKTIRELEKNQIISVDNTGTIKAIVTEEEFNKKFGKDPNPNFDDLPSDEELSDKNKDQNGNVFLIMLESSLKEELERQIKESRINFNTEPFRYRLSASVKDFLASIKGNCKIELINALLDKYAILYEDIMRKEEIRVLETIQLQLTTLKSSIEKKSKLDSDFMETLNAELQKIIISNKINSLILTYDDSLNVLQITYNSDVYNFENNTFEQQIVSKKLHAFIPQNLFDTYVAPKKEHLVDKATLRKVSEYLYANYPHGIVAYEKTVVNELMSCFELEEPTIAAIIDNLVANGLIKKYNNRIAVKLKKDQYYQKVDEICNLNSEEDKGLEGINVEVKQGGLDLNPNKPTQGVDTKDALILSGDALTISLVKNGIKIKYSQGLREKLSQLNAKLSLVNKENYRIRTSADITQGSEDQILAFKEDKEIRPEDYKIEIRLPKAEKELSKYEFDLEQKDGEIKARLR